MTKHTFHSETEEKQSSIIVRGVWGVDSIGLVLKKKEGLKTETKRTQEGQRCLSG